MSEDKQQLFQGTLQKKGGNKWKPKYAVIYSKNEFRYWENINDFKLNKKCQSKIDLNTCIHLQYFKDKIGKDYAFELITINRPYIFCAKTKEQYKQWLIILQKVIYGNLIMKGYLEKRGHKRKKWLKRYFELYETLKLIYFEDENKEICKGCIQLNKINKIEKPEYSKYNLLHVIELYTQNRIWLLKADTQKSQLKWEKQLKVVLGIEKIVLDNEIRYGYICIKI